MGPPVLTSRFTSAINDDGISKESGPFGSGNPLIGFQYLRSAITRRLGGERRGAVTVL